MHRISDFRMGGISRRNFSMFRQLCGDSTLKNVVIVTNMWGEVSPEVGEAREAELRDKDMFFKPVLDKHAQLLRHENTVDSAQAILHHIIGNRPQALKIQRELVDEHKDISQTAAGTVLNRELMEQVRKHQEELRNLQVEMKAAIKARDEETRKELEEESRKLQAEMSRVQNDSQKLASDYNEEKARMEQRMHAMEAAARKEAERAAGEHKKQMEELNARLQQTASTTAAEKNAIKQRMDDLQHKYEATRGHPSGGGGFFSQIGRALDSMLGML